MAYYITNTKAEAEEYNTDCTIAHGHNGSTTSSWAQVRKHPTKELFAIQKGAVDSEMELVEQLDDTWNEEIDI